MAHTHLSLMKLIDDILDTSIAFQDDIGIQTKPGKKEKHDDIDIIENNLHTMLKDYELKKYNSLKMKSKEKIKNEIKKPYIYPSLNDPYFIEKITAKKEFSSNYYPKQEGTVNTISDNICNREFEIAPHQEFVKTFLSNNTPYNSLLLYHGLGTGKTCSAISVCEEMRNYIKQYGIQKKIMIIASPNVQENFKKQLFNPDKLEKVNSHWNIRSCVGKSLLNEVNPLNNSNVNKKTLINEIKQIIKTNYIFMGYTEFANYINNILQKIDNIKADDEHELKTKISYQDKYKQYILKKEFSNRLIVIDEVHNIRISGDNINKKIAENLYEIVKNTDNLKLLLLSATPMFNDQKEIIWLLNLMNMNDKRSVLTVNEIFTKSGNFQKRKLKKLKSGKRIMVEGGEELLKRKMQGYVSFVRGENPYSFPYRIYPSMFDKQNTTKSKKYTYPKKQLNNININTPIQFSDIYLSSLGEIQKIGYDKLVSLMITELPDSDDFERGMGWQKVDPLLQSLNIVYPTRQIYKETTSPSSSISSTSSTTTSSITEPDFIGRQGLEATMDFTSQRKDFSYKNSTLKNHGRIFDQEHIHKYSHKLNSIIKNVSKSKGISIIYSQYIDSGCVPIALALEEMGFRRHDKSKGLFKEYKTETSNNEMLDVNTGKKYKDLTLEERTNFKPAKYAMITGDLVLSPNNTKELSHITNPENINGENVKVVIISRAGSEGIDFKFIRQIHILDPWYNMSRVEQIIGRAIRYCSHSILPLSERNCEIYLHGTKIPKTQIEPMDLYIYRKAEQKAIITGRITRLMKQTSIDCYLNYNISNLSEAEINEYLSINIASNKNINFPVGDKPFSPLCDYMESCSYTCNANINELYKHGENRNKDYLNTTTYDTILVSKSLEPIVEKIKNILREQFIISKDELIKRLNITRNYSHELIISALNTMNNNKAIQLIDKLGRDGYLIFKNNIIYFKPYDYDIDKLEYNTDIIKKPEFYNHKYKEIIMETPAKKQDELEHYLDEIYKQNVPKTKSKSIIKIAKKKNIKIINNIFLPLLTEHFLTTNFERNTDIYNILFLLASVLLLFHELFSQVSLKKASIKKYIKELDSNMAIIYKKFGIELLDLTEIEWYYGYHKFLTEQYMNEPFLQKMYTKQQLLNFFIQHIFDTSSYLFKKHLIGCLNTEFFNNLIRENTFEYSGFSLNETIIELKKYINQYNFISIYREKSLGYMIQKETSVDIFVFNKDKDSLSNPISLNESLTIATPIQKKYFETYVERNEPKPEQVAAIFAFIKYIPRTSTYSFKTKYINDKRSKGARCLQSGQVNIQAILKFLYENFGEDKYVPDNIISCMCVEQELLMRLLQSNSKTKHWFFTPEYTEQYNVESIYRDG